MITEEEFSQRKEISEKEFLSQVIDLLKLFGWRFCHFRAARTSHGWRTAISGDKGFPDIVAVRLSRLLFIELKSEKGKVSPEQQQWLDDLEATGKCEVYLWRPGDIDEIVEVLK